MNPRKVNPTEPQFGSKAALAGTETLKWLADQGISTFVPLPPGSKAPLYKDWNTRENAKAAHEIENANRINVGLLCFDGVVVIDRDVAFPTTVERLRSLGKTVKVIRSNAPDRGALIYWVRDTTVFSETYRPQPRDKPTMELITLNPNGTAKHKVVAGSHRGGRYELHDTRYGIRQITLAELDIIWQRNVNARLRQCVEQELAASMPKKHQGPRSYRARRRCPGALGARRGNLAQQLRETWTAYDVFEYHGYCGDTKTESGGDLRIFGHGGLIVGGHAAPNAWRWYCFADDTGGDIFDAWTYCTTGVIVDRADPESFKAVLSEMAEAGNPLGPPKAT